MPETERVVAPPATDNLKAVKWRLAVDLATQTPDSADGHLREPRPNEETRRLGSLCSGQPLESRLHAVERVPSEGRGKPAQFVPIRFVFRNKLTKDDRLLLAFDALVLSQILGRAVGLGKIIHGDDHATLKVRTSALAGEVRKRLDKIAALFSNSAPPDLVLNRHCAECEFQARCRKLAVEKDDLSLLAGMSAKERQKLRGKGIFTVTQLSYTFRPRRRPKRMRDNREKYHHALKALAIREKKIHIVGSPELKIEGTPVYLDVEGLPDRDFYYLIGVRIGHGESAVQHSLWADTVEDEGKIWREFLAILETVEKPVLIHYGSYETIFLKRMCELHGVPPEGSTTANIVRASVNIVSHIFAQIYFPGISNGLKDTANTLGFKWAEAGASGLNAIAWRCQWEDVRGPTTKERLLAYNAQDCEALSRVTAFARNLCEQPHHDSAANATQIVRTEEIPRERERWEMFSPKKYAVEEFKQINKCAYFDYQRERVFVRTHPQFKKINRKQPRPALRTPRVNSTINLEPKICPKCGRRRVIVLDRTNQIVTDLKISKHGVRRWVYCIHAGRCECLACGVQFSPKRPLRHSEHYGYAMMCWCVYLATYRGLNMERTSDFVTDVFDVRIPECQMYVFKRNLSAIYAKLYSEILDSLKQGRLLHIDETSVNLKGQTGFVWVLAGIDRVFYLYRPTREASFLEEMLKGFDGVLVSDFYSGYDSLDCNQQKCLVHFIRDIDEDIWRNPFDAELKATASAFGTLLQAIIQTVDRFGLKKRHLNKHKKNVNQFLQQQASRVFSSEAAKKYKARFQKSGRKMFTFLDFDGVPWNNNNAEHAIKRFAKYRRETGGRFTEVSLNDYLVLATVFETCEFNSVSVLKFLLSKETTFGGLLRMAGSKRHWQTPSRARKKPS